MEEDFKDKIAGINQLLQNLLRTPHSLAAPPEILYRPLVIDDL